MSKPILEEKKNPKMLILAFEAIQLKFYSHLYLSLAWNILKYPNFPQIQQGGYCQDLKLH